MKKISKMKPSKFIIFIFALSACISALGQYDFIINSLNIHSQVIPRLLDGYFYLRSEVHEENEINYYDFSNAKYDFCYYPKQTGIDCGYFILNGELIVLKDKYPNDLGCDLDYGSFELSEINLGDKQYLIITGIRYGSGTTTRHVYCILIDLAQSIRVKYFPLWSLYGSKRCFGDFNADGKIDFLEIRYDPHYRNPDIFRLTFSTLEHDVFVKDESKYISFKREFVVDGLPKIIPLEKNW